MWKAKYKNIDKNSLSENLKITVVFSNDQNDTIYESIYYSLPNELDVTFPRIVQSQIDILNSKDIPQKTLDDRIDTEISLASIITNL